MKLLSQDGTYVKFMKLKGDKEPEWTIRKASYAKLLRHSDLIIVPVLSTN